MWTFPASSGGGGSPTKVPYAFTNSKALAPFHSTASTTFVVTANRICAMPFYIGVARTITEVAISVSVAAAGNCLIGIYNDASGRPGTKVVESSAISTNATGKQTATISQALQAGWYWALVVFDATPTVHGPTSVWAGMGADNSSPPVNVRGIFRSFTYGALPSDETASTFSLGVSTVIPFVTLA